ncbi:restriction endonuclease subunit S [Bacteroides sp. UBA939]|uniref:restriction endonuclease subunit S n=1 Tax=Bacteroides sp. UBA939 TaxID=1946092 RepID=UPI0025C241AD|nr:restriction endonuclease subunit S [Bacteroides sp. UBA939]
MQKKIQDIATIRSGAYIKEVPEGVVCYLQVSDFNRTEGKFLLPKPTLEFNSKIESHLMLEGDLIFAAKGASNFCTVFDERMGKAVASSSFLVIRITDRTIITPDYLCWILNREDSLTFFKANAIGTSIPSIGKTLVEEFGIDIPTMQVQQKIIEIARLQRQEQKLYRQISDLRNKLTQQQLIEIAK